MTRSKLSATDREELIRLFKETTETITSLANRFEVSISTARRVLKTQLSAEEYEVIVASRQEGRQNKKQNISTKPSKTNVQTDQSDGVEANSLEESELDTTSKPKPRRRRRRSSASSAETSTELHPEIETEETLEPPTIPAPSQKSPSHKPIPAKALKPDLEEIDPLEVLPIDAASFPNQCYLVVDRSSELITPPLREFSELGRIPSSEESAKTLPVFANHKIASRFSRRSQRIIKIPNSSILEKTYTLLNAKGVERILFDGQVFTLK